VVNFTSPFALLSGNHPRIHRTGGLVRPQSRFGWFGNIGYLFLLRNSNRDLCSQYLGAVYHVILATADSSRYPGTPPSAACVLHMKSSLLFAYSGYSPVARCSGLPRGVVWGVQTPHPRNSEDTGGVLDRMSKKNRRLDFLLQFTVFSYGCNTLNKGFF